MNSSLGHTSKQIEASLQRCRRRILLAGLREGFWQGVQYFVDFLPLLAGFFLLWRLVAWASLIVAPHLLHLLLAAALAALLIVGWSMLRARRRWNVSPTEAAERLDLAEENHNQIATALALSRSGDNSPFAQAAIDSGREQLERLQEALPYMARAPIRWSRQLGLIALALILGLLGFLTVSAPAPGEVDLASAIPAPTAEPTEAPQPGVDDLTSETAEPPVATPTPKAPERPPKNPSPGKKTEPVQASAEQQQSKSKAAGPMGEEASGRSQVGRASSDSRSAASGAAAESEPGKKEPAKPRKPKSPASKKPTVPKPGQEEEKKKAGSIAARGSSGSGAMRSVQNDWTSKVKAKSEERDDADLEDMEDEAMDPDKQRMGAQPALKNRSSKISRQLSLFMGQDQRNNQKRGRGGGAGAEKKSRGTATMIMGVPIPGFVQGRLKEGPSKSTQEDVEPSPRLNDYVAATTIGESDPEEAGQERYSPPASLGIRSRDYLINYHKQYGNTENDNVTDR